MGYPDDKSDKGGCQQPDKRGCHVPSTMWPRTGVCAQIVHDRIRPKSSDSGRQDGEVLGGSAAHEMGQVEYGQSKEAAEPGREFRHAFPKPWILRPSQ